VNLKNVYKIIQEILAQRFSFDSHSVFLIIFCFHIYHIYLYSVWRDDFQCSSQGHKGSTERGNLRSRLSGRAISPSRLRVYHWLCICLCHIIVFWIIGAI